MTSPRKFKYNCDKNQLNPTPQYSKANPMCFLRYVFQVILYSLPKHIGKLIRMFGREEEIDILDKDKFRRQIIGF
jgi:hypothetical protein